MSTNKKEAQSHGSYESMLQKNNKKLGLKPDNTSTYNYELKIQRKGNDPTPHEKRMGDKRTGSNDTVTEKSLNENKKIFNEKRNSDTWKQDAPTINMLDEARNQNQAKALKEAEEKDRNTSFWDDYVGVQMISPKTKITSNVQKSQLENDPERFANLQDVDMSNLKPNEAIDSVLNKAVNVDKMVFASLNDADAMLFNIYYKSAGRKLTKDEKQMVRDINASKMRIFAQGFDGGRYERIVFLQGSEADEALQILDEQGEQAALDYLSNWWNKGEHEQGNEHSYGASDKIFESESLEGPKLILSYNEGLGYIGLEADYGEDEDEVINDNNDDDLYGTRPNGSEDSWSSDAGALYDERD